MKKRLLKILIVFLLASAVVVSTIYIKSTKKDPAVQTTSGQTTEPETEVKELAWYEKHTLIAHALGGINKMHYTNSLEAFKQSYGKGFRLFEVDLLATSDGELVGRHSWVQNGDDYSKDNIPAAKTFLESPLFGSYTSLSFLDILKLAKEYPDIYFITDTKRTKAKDMDDALKYMTDIAKEEGLTEVFEKQFITQAYNIETCDVVKKWVKPENIMLTFYRAEKEDYPSLIEYCTNNNVPIITIKYNYLNKEFKEQLKGLDLKVAVYTLNDTDKAKNRIRKGAVCVFTDYLNPSDF